MNHKEFLINLQGFMSLLSCLWSLLLVFLIIFLIATTNVSAKNLETDTFTGDPSCHIFAYSDKIVVNRGDSVYIDFYISSVGNVDASKFSYSISPNVVKNDVTLTFFTFETKEGMRGYDYINPIGPPVNVSLDDRFSFTLPIEYFKPSRIYSINPGGISNYGEKFFNYSGMKYAPFTLDFIVDDKSPTGNHVISLVLFYKNGSRWYSTNQNITLHVNHWYEQTWVHVLLILSSILSIPVIVYEIGKRWNKFFKIIFQWMLNYLKKLY